MYKRILPVLLAGALVSFSASGCSAQDNNSQAGGVDEVPARNASRRLPDPPPGDDDISNSRQNAITRAVAKASPAVVGINVTEVQEYRIRDPFADDPVFQEYFGRRHPRTYQREIHGLGSGFIISADGYVVTNDHVAGSATKVIVTMTDGKQYDARVIGSDPTTDVALLKIEGKNLPYVTLGSSSDAIVGEWVIALGNPFGLFDINSKPTVTVGVVSNTGVNLAPQDNRVYRGMIQTDAAISSGNSGGPLVNSLGQVIAMNTIIYSTSQSAQGSGSIGIGFAVPIDRVKAIVSELRKGVAIDRNFWTGMAFRQMDANIARYLKTDIKEGIVVAEIAPNSPASRAGLEVGDIIININSENIRTEDDAISLLADSRVGETAHLRIVRDGRQSEKSLVLTRRGE
jgi:serine protease Do